MKNGQQNYIPPDSSSWQGRSDTPQDSAIFQIIKLCNLAEDNSNSLKHLKNAFGLIGFCCDEGVRRNLGRVGASDGPHAIRQAFARLPIHDLSFEIYDFGDVVCKDGNLEAAQSALSAVIEILISQGITPIVMGGGHEVAFGHYRGIRKAISKSTLGIVNFDAHLDMRPLLENYQGSSGTPFLQIAQECEKNNLNFNYSCVGVQKTGNLPQLFNTAKKYNAEIIFAEELHQKEMGHFFSFVEKVIEKNQHIYMTICLDVFSVAYAPGVSAIQPLGLSPWHIIPLIRKLAESGKIVSYDIAELNPAYDPDERTAKLAASLIYEIITHAK